MTPAQTAVASPAPSTSATAVAPSVTPPAPSAPVPSVSTATVVPTTPPAAPSAADANSVLPAVVSGAFLAAMLAALINIWLARRRSRAWEASPIESDTAMNIPPAQIDLSALQPLETAYIAAVREHLRALKNPWWSR